MVPLIIEPKTEFLKKYVQYFLFFRKSNNDTISYTTFPNTNLCIAIYRENKVEYVNNSFYNTCNISHESNKIISRLYGFHQIPFQVNISSNLDQICIILHPASISAFTNKSISDLCSYDSVFEEIFTIKDKYTLEKIFDQKDLFKRAEILELIILNSLIYTINPLVQKIIFLINENTPDCYKIEQLCGKINISDTTLFRLFKSEIGQNPKRYINTLRFRNALDTMIKLNQSLTTTALSNQYYDQAHFINNFKKFSGSSPRILLSHLLIQQKHLKWITDKNKTHE